LCHDYNNDGYIDHVSLYIGNGTCIHASNSRMGVITSAWPMGSVVTIRRFV
jgi:cell wall-associated NlpC family hydrolase